MARADGSALTVEEAAGLLARNPTVRLDTSVVRALADLWIDYRLLAGAVGDDSTVRPADLEALVAPEREEALALKLRDTVVPPPADVRDAADEDRERDRERGTDARAAAAFAREQREEMARRRRELGQADREQAYIAAMERTAGVALRPGAVAAVRALTAHPDATTGEAADSAQVVATYAGGEVTVGALRAFLRLQPPAVLATLARADQAQGDAVVRQLVRKQLLLAQARTRGLTLTRADTNALRARVRADVRARVASAGFASLAGRRPTPATTDSSVRALLAAAIERRTTAPPLDVLGARLRLVHPATVDPRAFAPVVARVQALRAVRR